MCTEQIDRLMKQSNGGFGAYLLLAHEWANPVATRNYELISRHVMPQFQASAANLEAAKRRAEDARELLASKSLAAVDQMRARHEAESTSRV